MLKWSSENSLNLKQDKIVDFSRRKVARIQMYFKTDNNENGDFTCLMRVRVLTQLLLPSGNPCQANPDTAQFFHSEQFFLSPVNPKKSLYRI